MSYIKLISFLILISRIASVYSQQEIQQSNKLAFKFSPLSLHVPFVGRSLRVSCEYKIKNRFSLENEFGFFFDRSGGYLGKVELKHYINDGNVGEYYSLELFVKNQYYSTSDTISSVLKKYEVNKYVECLTFKYGESKVFRFGLILDGFVGIGIRFQQNSNSLTEEDNSRMPSTSDYGPNLLINKAGNRIYPNLTVGFKIGFSVKK